MLDMQRVRAQIEQGYIRVDHHPGDDLHLYSYTAKAQYDWHWTAETMKCRGLVLDGQDQIVARPFEKFFTYEQLGGRIPSEPFEVYDKVDGSLGILYPGPDGWAIATRGSFTSEQAQEGTRILRERYRHCLWKLDPNITLLFEIIYPENRIVVDYGSRRDLTLLAGVIKATGEEIPYSDLAYFGFPVVERFDGIEQFDQVLQTQDPDREGFVVRFQNGKRVKVKFAEYLRLHRLLTGVTPKMVWEELRADGDLESLINRVPDEFHRWLTNVRDDLTGKFQAVLAQARQEFRDDFPTRKEAAAYFKTCRYPALLFQLYDGKDPTDQVWKMIRPQSGRAFRCDDSE